jgi:hypothetical protein
VETIARIQEKLAARGLSLNPVASDTEVKAFESRHSITLPPDYRLFITTVGNGGPGPADYGILRLGTIASDLLPDERRYWTELADIRKPFPFTRYWVWEDGEPSTEGSRDQVAYGSIMLGTDGCGMYWHLIVTGSDRGIPWQLCGEGIQPVYPKRSFTEWYEDWLDGKNTFYGLQNNGD